MGRRKSRTTVAVPPVEPPPEAPEQPQEPAEPPGEYEARGMLVEKRGRHLRVLKITIGDDGERTIEPSEWKQRNRFWHDLALARDWWGRWLTRGLGRPMVG